MPKVRTISILTITYGKIPIPLPIPYYAKQAFPNLKKTEYSDILPRVREINWIGISYRNILTMQAFPT